MDPVIDEEVDETLDGLDHLDDESGETQTVNQPGTTGKTTTKQPAEWEQAIAELAKTVKTGQAQAPATPKAPPTQDEINQYWGVWDPNKENPAFIREFFNLPEDADQKVIDAATKRFKTVQENLVKQALVGASRVMEQRFARLEEEYSPVKQYVSEAKAEKVRNNFFKAYPALATENEDGNPRYAKILSLAASELAQDEFSNDKAYFKALAERAVAVIKDAGIPIDLNAGKTKTRETPRLPRTSVGGSGGAGGMTGAFKALAAKGDATDEFLEED